MGRTNANFRSSTPDWQSPWPVGDPNRTAYQTPAQQSNTMRKVLGDARFFDLQKGNGVPSSILNPQAAAPAWKSPWPESHPNLTEYQSPAQQTKNMQGKGKGGGKAGGAIGRSGGAIGIGGIGGGGGMNWDTK